MERDYSPKGVRFYYLYKALAHPEYNLYVKPFSMEERLMHVREAERTLGSRIPWLADTMSNAVKHALGGVPNADLIFDPEGRVVARHGWNNPAEVREVLERLIGPVENPTRVEDLNMPEVGPPPTVARGLVPRVHPKGSMRALLLEPVPGKNNAPFFVKLRAEGDKSLLATGSGSMYLGFHLDPLYRVHWNNEVDPLEFEVKGAEGVTITPAWGQGPTVTEPADADPREFLVQITAPDTGVVLDITTRYFACDDDNTFCMPVTQSYRVQLVADKDGGTVMGRSGSGHGRRHPGGSRHAGGGRP